MYLLKWVVGCNEDVQARTQSIPLLSMIPTSPPSLFFGGFSNKSIVLFLYFWNVPTSFSQVVVLVFMKVCGCSGLGRDKKIIFSRVLFQLFSKNESANTTTKFCYQVISCWFFHDLIILISMLIFTGILQKIAVTLALSTFQS